MTDKSQITTNGTSNTRKVVVRVLPWKSEYLVLKCRYSRAERKLPVELPEMTEWS